MKRIILLAVYSLFFISCNNNQIENKNINSPAKKDKSSSSDEEDLFLKITDNYIRRNYLDVQSRSEEFYKNYKLSERLDSVELMYEEAIDSLEAREMREEGSLAFKRYRLNENPILNPNPKMNSPASDFLDKFVGKRSEFANLVKENLRESNSFEYIETKFMDKKSGYIALVMKFKAKNGLGNIVERKALGKFDKITETFSDIKIKD